MTAFIGYDDQISEALLTSTGTFTSPLESLANGQTWNRAIWTPAAGSYNFTATFTPAPVDYVAFYGGTLASASSIQIEIDEGGWTVADVISGPFAGGPLIHRLPTAYTATGVRITILSPTALELAVVYAGRILELPESITATFTPPPLGRVSALDPVVSNTGHYMGTLRRREGWRFQIAQKNVEPAWMAAEWLPMITTMEVWPFFFSWAHETAPADTVFGWLDGKQTPPSYSNPIFMGWQLKCRGLHELTQ